MFQPRRSESVEEFFLILLSRPFRDHIYLNASLVAVRFLYILYLLATLLTVVYEQKLTLFWN